ncbi:hypothetical protein BDW02DRAFT_162732 [Decorospora gaudefroyi]|uniref:Uncharacterized protein n=1 Tax=Decorospora gaudefroyi TaxID=184978 RepID=A0A6A5KN99_9PLEO|nr:hypothetical protein BDW02DRAFT_162732 [Decorospora gaudefroyi]
MQPGKHIAIRVRTFSPPLSSVCLGEQHEQRNQAPIAPTLLSTAHDDTPAPSPSSTLTSVSTAATAVEVSPWLTSRSRPSMPITACPSPCFAFEEKTQRSTPALHSRRVGSGSVHVPPSPPDMAAQTAPSDWEHHVPGCGSIHVRTAQNTPHGRLDGSCECIDNRRAFRGCASSECSMFNVHPAASDAWPATQRHGISRSNRRPVPPSLYS